jgi:Stress responsive A/B Barrel Domain
VFRHVVLFTWTGDATDAQKQAVHDELPKMPPAIDVIRAYSFGPDAGVNPANCDYAVVADFDDRAGYLTYRDHPAHRELVERFVTPIVARRAAIQFEF